MARTDDAQIQARIGVAVRTRRRELGLTQEELAWRAHLHRTYIADIERGARNVTLRSVVNLAQALEVTAGNLLSFALPAKRAGASARAVPSAAPAEILLIEDNPADVTMTERAFRRAGIANPLRVVRDAESALHYLGGTARFARRPPSRPQLILLDLNLPRMSGLEFLRHLKTTSETRDIPVIVLTVSESDLTIIECGRLGAANYIVKPIAIERMLKLTPRLNLQLTLGAMAAEPSPAPR